jgi:hypothetical protein
MSALYPADVTSMTDPDSGSETGLAKARSSTHPLKLIAEELSYPLFPCKTTQSFGSRKRYFDASDSEMPAASPTTPGRG